MTEEKQPREAKWYVVHTYSGYENKVKTTLETVIENRGLQEMIQETVRAPGTDRHSVQPMPLAART